MNTMYQFAVSHYCEKARWAMDLKGQSYQIKNLLPGPHAKKMHKLANDTSVPVVAFQNTVIQGSDKIIDYLDETCPDSTLTPVNPEDAKQAREWEQYAAHHIGDPIRCLLYHELLEHKDLLISVLTHNAPWYGKHLYRFIYNDLKKRIRQGMKINDRTASIARKTLTLAFDKLDEELRGKSYLVGNTFSRADLSVAAMSAPLVWPANSWFIWTENIPESINQFRAPFTQRSTFHWVNEIYQNHRKPVAS